MDEPQPKGRSMSELRQLIAEDGKRWLELASYWGDLMDDEKDALIAFAKQLAETPSS